MATLLSYFAPPIAGEWGDEAEDHTDGVPVLRTTNFTADGRLSYDDLTYRSIDTEKKENKILQPGDIIIEKSGGTPKKPVGRCVYFDRDDDYDYFCSNFTAILRANTEEVNTKYLWYLLQEHYKTRQCLKYQYKTNGIANLDIKDYLSHKEVELPPREVQDKRVEAMDYSQYLLDLHQELLEIMDNAVKSRFVEMFGEILDNGIPLAQLAEITGGLTKNSKRNTFPNQMPYLRVANVLFNQLDLSEVLTIGVKDNEIEKTMLCKGDLLFVEGNGSVEQIGRVAVWDGSIEPCLHQNHLIKARFNSRKINPVYALFYFMSQKGRAQIVRQAVSTSGLHTLSVGKIESLELPVPPIEKQNQFADFVALTDKSELTIQKSMDNLQELRDSLLQDYFG